MVERSSLVLLVCVGFSQAQARCSSGPTAYISMVDPVIESSHVHEVFKRSQLVYDWPMD